MDSLKVNSIRLFTITLLFKSDNLDKIKPRGESIRQVDRPLLGQILLGKLLDHLG